MSTVRISEAEAERDFTALLARVRAGAEIVIESDLSSAVTLRPAAESSLRRLSHSLRLAKEHASTTTLDDEFSRDLEATVRSHPEPAANLWD